MASERQTLPIAILGSLALGILLASVDALIHMKSDDWLNMPVITTRSLTWMALFYGGASGVAVVLLRRGWRVLAVMISGFVFGQCGLWFYRTDVAGSVFTLRALTVLGLAALIAIALVSILSWLLRWLRAHSLAPLTVVDCLALVGAISFLLPTPVADPPASWPRPQAASSLRKSDRPHVLLLTLDTLRPDHVGAYGYNRILTPNLDQLAREGALFRRAIAQAPLTPPSHASILSGVLPTKHGLRNFDRDNHPSSQHRFLAEALNETGYLTGAIIASVTLDPAFGLDRGFDVYHYVPPSETYLFAGCKRCLLPTVLTQLGIAKDRTMYRTAREQTDDAILWLDTYQEIPFFLWVHYFDPHDPYFPSSKYRKPKFHPGREWKDRFGTIFQYDSEIVGVDDQIGRLIRHLSDLDLFDKTIVAVISDHGEGLGDHQYFGHTARLYNEQLEIALLLRYPREIPADVSVATQVRSVDLMPTLLELLGAPIPDDLDGSSLLPLVKATGDRRDRIAFSETLEPSRREQQLVAVSDGRYKLIRSLSGREWLFDLGKDPEEKRNMNGEVLAVEKRLGGLLDSYLGESRPGDHEKAKKQGEELDDGTLEKLKSLGYIE